MILEQILKNISLAKKKSVKFCRNRSHARLSGAVFQKSILKKVCQLLEIRAKKMAPRASQGLQERAPAECLWWYVQKKRVMFTKHFMDGSKMGHDFGHDSANNHRWSRGSANNH
jgi:hypothetical protein